MEKILIVADDSSIAEELSALLRKEGFAPDTAPGDNDLTQRLSGRHYDVVVFGIPVKRGKGLHLLSQVTEASPSAGIVVVAPPSDKDAPKLVLRNEADLYLPQPVGRDLLKQSIRLAMAHRRLLLENRELKRQVAMYGKSQEISNCLDLDRLASLTVAAVAAETGVERGLGLFLDAEGYLSLKGLNGLDEATGRALGERIMAAFERRDKRRENVVLVRDLLPDDDAIAAATGVRDSVICGMSTEEQLRGIIAVFNNKGERLSADLDLASLSLLGDQTSKAVDNAIRYSAAKNLANIDELTGLFNYRYLETALDREIKRAERYRSSLSVVFLDLDQFKVINDTHGHLVGSKVLKEVGVLIKRLVREVDTVIRYGGDEYTIILVESTNVGAARVAERIRSAVEQFTFLAREGYSIKLTASLGYACYPDDSKTHTELLDMADQAMYRGKFSGRNVVFHIRQGDDNAQGE